MSAEEAAYRANIAAGDEARAEGRWDTAIEHYASALTFKPDNAAIRVQLGHGLKELGRLPEAEAAYRAASTMKPEDADILLQLGHVLKMQGRQQHALEAYADALRHDPGFEPARSELIAAGGRNRLPESLYGRSATTDALTRLSVALREEQGALRDVATVSTYPVEAYDAFRHAFPVQPPADPGAFTRSVVVLIDATNAQPGEVRLTLTSLMDQSAPDWRAVVWNGGPIGDHPIASLADQDTRITFSEVPADAWPAVPEYGALLLCDAGLAFDPEALGWFQMAIGRTGVDFVYADHDHHTHHWRRGRTYADPAFQWMPDQWDMAQTPRPPAALLVGPSQRSEALEAIAEVSGSDLRRRLLVEGLTSGSRATHIPRLLSSLRMPALDGPVDTRPVPAPVRMKIGEHGPEIRIIIPTRDEPRILKACVDSLLAQAARPDRLRLQIVDNRSVAPETAEFLKALEADPRIQVDRFDAPFNWARINNVAAASCLDGSVLVFANNDIEMLTRDWDLRLLETLADPGVGLIGTRLLYPDRTVQHAGVVLGVNDSRPVHEGLGRPKQEVGPNSRWVRTRQVAAVTGAFMALHESVFRRLGGFDERLAVGYNDIDLCLKARSHGLAVLYQPGIELIHHESKTRGRADASKVSWDDEELTDLHARWGRWMMFDPGKNPHWFSTHERPFDGLRNPGRRELFHHIDLSARSRPWSIDQAADPWRESEM